MRRVVINLTSSDNPVGVLVSSSEHSGVTTVENENRLVLSFGVSAISALFLEMFLLYLSLKFQNARRPMPCP